MLPSEDDIADDVVLAAFALYPVRAVRATDEQIAAAQHFVDIVARIDQHGDAFRHLCILLCDTAWWRRAETPIPEISV